MANVERERIKTLAREVQQQLAIKELPGLDGGFNGPNKTETGGLWMAMEIGGGLTLGLWICRFSGAERLWYGFASKTKGEVAEIVGHLKEWKPETNVVRDSDWTEVRWNGGKINQLSPPLKPSQLGVLTHERYDSLKLEYLGVFSKRDVRKAAVRDLARDVVGMVLRLDAIVPAKDWSKRGNASASAPYKRTVGPRDEIITPRHRKLQDRYLKALGHKSKAKEDDRFVDIVIYGSGSAIKTLVEVKPTRNIGETRAEFREALGQLYEARWRLCRNSKRPPHLIVVMDHEPRANTKAFAKSVGCVCAWPAKRGRKFRKHPSMSNRGGL